MRDLHRTIRRLQKLAAEKYPKVQPHQVKTLVQRVIGVEVSEVLDGQACEHAACSEKRVERYFMHFMQTEEATLKPKLRALYTV